MTRAPHFQYLRRGRAALVLLVMTLPACGGSKKETADLRWGVPLVEAVEARYGALPIEVTVPGTVRAENQVSIRPEVAGRVVEVLVRDGDSAERGQALVRLDAVEARERLRQAEAEVALAEAAAAAARARFAELEARVVRTRTLAEERLVSAQELDTIEAQLDVLAASTGEAAARVEAARAAAEERRSAVGKTVVRAPVAGRIGERRVEVGMLVDSSDVLFVIGDLDELIVEVDLTETMLERVEEGQPVEIESRSEGPPLSATLSRISPFLAEESFTTRGEIEVDNRAGRLRPGMFVSVRILVGESERAALIPVSALWEEPDSRARGVFVVEEADGLAATPRDTTKSPADSRAIGFRSIEVLAEGRGVAGVTGIEEGTWVVTVGQHLLNAERRSAAATSPSESAGAARGVRARVRPISWDRITTLQNLQNEDLLADFLDKQRKVATALGAEIPQSEEVVNQVLEGSTPDGRQRSGGQ